MRNDTEEIDVQQNLRKDKMSKNGTNLDVKEAWESLLFYQVRVFHVHPQNPEEGMASLCLPTCHLGELKHNSSISIGSVCSPC